MVVVRADDDGLVPEPGIVAGEHADHVAARQPAHVGVLRHGGVRLDPEGLKPAAGRGLQADGSEPARQVGGGGVGARGAGEPAGQAVTAQKPDVVERQDRKHDGTRGLAGRGPELRVEPHSPRNGEQREHRKHSCV